MEIADRRVATLHFTLTDEAGSTITSTRGHDPLVYQHGAGSIVRGLEQALEGRKAGDRFRVTVQPQDGFGQYHDVLHQTLPRAMWRAEKAPEVGDRLEGTSALGQVPLRVVAVEGDTITVDGNHPLAGRVFEADVEVLDVRVPTPDEVQFGLG